MIVTKDGHLALVIGSPGGPHTITITLEAFINMVDHGMDVQTAIDAPRIHHQWLPDVVSLEPFAISADTRKLLEQRGYTFSDEGRRGVAAGIVTDAPTLRTATDRDKSVVVSFDTPPLAGATMFGGHDGRGEAIRWSL